MTLKSVFTNMLFLSVLLMGGSLLSPVSVPVLSAAEFEAESVVNLNSADAETLQQVRGIGPALAERIIFFREEHGPFHRVEDITQVRGIGSAKFEKIKTQIVV